MKKTKEILSWILPPAIAFAIFWFLFSYIFIIAWIPSESMSPTIKPHSMVIGLRLLGDIETGDIVIFKGKDQNNQEIQYIKRVAGKGNEMLQIKGGDVYIDGTQIDYPFRHTTTDGDEFGPIDIPADSFIMLGDNQDHSYDSRKWENPFVEQKDIMAKALFGFGDGDFSILF